MRGLGRRVVEAEQQTCLPREIEDRGPPSRCPEDMLQRVVYHQKREALRWCTNLSQKARVSKMGQQVQFPGVATGVTEFRTLCLFGYACDQA